tara:strand:- start:423 stop:563 length:141 start_codon:yes stop_codon:yes gene_type:complete
MGGFKMSYCEIYEHYAHYVDEMGIEQPIGFELWVSEYLNDLIEVIK